MSAIPSNPSADQTTALYNRLNWRLLPFLLVCYLFACLDRLNIGFAKLQMQSDLGFSDAVYGVGAGIFFLGYVLFEVPSNLLLPRLGARKTISRILVLWGLTSASMLFIHNVTMFYGLRFLLGVFEAGFAPGMIFYLTYWYGEARMARAIATVMIAGPLSGVVGGPLSTWTMTAFAGAFGLAGWQWMFLVEGLPCILLGVVAWFFLADRPATATWLSADERRTLDANLATPAVAHHSFGQVLRDPRVYLMAIPYFCVICGIYTVNFWLPTIIKADGVKNTLQIGLYSTIPYIAAVIGMYIGGRSSDRFRERRWHSAVPALVGALALAGATLASGQLALSLICMTVATAMMWVSYTVFWAIPSEYLKGDVAAGGIALINTIGLLGGFFSPTIIGWAKTATGSLQAGLYVMVGLLALGAVLLLANPACQRARLHPKHKLRSLYGPEAKRHPSHAGACICARLHGDTELAFKILIAGFQHETNTFAPSPATYDSFVRGEGHPAMARGEAVLALRDVNLPIGGFISASEQHGHTLIPIIWTAASPSAQVTEDAYERIVGEIVAAVAQGGFDAVYLDLHGAMVARHVDDGEGELLARIRTEVGAEVPVVASLDLHANVTERMLASADALVAYRTYPHVDMAETGARAERLLTRLLVERKPLAKAARRLPFLIPINGMCTMLEPAHSMYAKLGELEEGPVVSLSFTPGFPAADFPECGPVIWGYGEDSSAARQAVDALYDLMLRDESKWAVPFLSPDAAVAEAMRLSATADKPVVIADTQDNPGAGADSNTTGMLRALLDNGAQGAALGLIWDPEAAAQAHAAGVGARLEVALGGRSGTPGDKPFAGTFEVVALSDGRCRYDGPMMHGMQVDLGPVACLAIGGVRIAVSSTKAQMLDRNLYRVAGIEPEAMKILVNKSSVHFRADFEPIAHAVLVAKAPGPMTADPADLPWKRLTPGIRLRPMGEPFSG